MSGFVYVNLYKLSWPSEGPKDGQIIMYFNAWGDPISGDEPRNMAYLTIWFPSRTFLVIVRHSWGNNSVLFHSEKLNGFGT